MRMRIPLAIIPLAEAFIIGWTAGAADAPITSNPIPEPIVKRGSPSRSRIWFDYPILMRFVPQIRILRHRRGRVSAMYAIYPMAAVSQTIREDFCT